ncbi:MAG: fumarate hydratase class II [Zhongshania sp.]|jgi:fumarate hydratase class II
MAVDSRIEHDSLGAVSVPANRYWGAQTQRSLQNFAIGEQRFGADMVTALAQINYAAAFANLQLGVLDAELAQAIQQAA